MVFTSDSNVSWEDESSVFLPQKYPPFSLIFLLPCLLFVVLFIRFSKLTFFPSHLSLSPNLDVIIHTWPFKHQVAAHFRDGIRGCFGVPIFKSRFPASCSFLIEYENDSAIWLSLVWIQFMLKFVLPLQIQLCATHIPASQTDPWCSKILRFLCAPASKSFIVLIV